MTRRIIVALDESPPSLAALESAVHLAAEISGEILGIFIEDIDMIAVAGLPGRSMVSFQGASTMPLDETVLLRSLRVRARRLREEVARMAESYGVPWRFETTRGHASEEILRLAGACEMIAMGASSYRGPGIYGSTARMIIDRARCAVLVVRRGLPPTERILVLSQDGPNAREVGASLARRTGAQLILQEPPKGRRAAFDLLMRLSPSYVVIDRPSLAALDISARELAETLKLEGLIITDGAPDAS